MPVALREEFRQSGEWLFRWRSYVPLLPLAAVLASLLLGAHAPPSGLTRDREWMLFCFALSLTGLGVRALTVGFVPAGTSGRNTAAGQIARTLNTTGAYSVVRHPLYLANYLMWLGVVLVPRSAALTIIVSLFYWLYYERIMFAEEEFLRTEFGDRWELWASHTPAFVPDFRRWTPPRLTFSLRAVLRREPSSFFAIVATFAAMDVVGHYGAEHRWWIDPLWAAVLSIGIATFAVLVFLKRTTHLLEAPGR